MVDGNVLIDSPEDNRNRNRLIGSHRWPTGTSFFTGCDPVDHAGVRDGSGSNAAACTIAIAKSNDWT